MDGPRRPRRILLATDGSPSANAALDVLCAMRFAPDDRVDIVSVGQHGAAEITARAAEQLRCCGVAAEIRVASGPWRRRSSTARAASGPTSSWSARAAAV